MDGGPDVGRNGEELQEDETEEVDVGTVLTRTETSSLQSTWSAA